MITKTVRQSGGSFDNWAAAVADLQASYPFTDDREYLLERGVDWGEKSTPYLLIGDAQLMGVYELTIKEDPNSGSGRARLLGEQNFGGEQSQPKVIFENLLLGHDGVRWPISINNSDFTGTRFFKFKNCTIFSENASGLPRFFNMSGGAGTPVDVDQCGFILTSPTNLGATNSDLSLRNSWMVVFKATDWNVEFQSGGVGVYDSITLYNYGTGNATTSGTGTVTNLTKDADPLFEDDAIQSASDLLLTMMARNVQQADAGSSVYNNGNAATALPTDIDGTVRPKDGADDRGPFEGLFFVAVVTKTVSDRQRIDGRQGDNPVHWEEWDVVSDYIPNFETRYCKLEGASASHILKFKSILGGLATPMKLKSDEIHKIGSISKAFKTGTDATKVFFGA